MGKLKPRKDEADLPNIHQLVRGRSGTKAKLC